MDASEVRQLASRGGNVAGFIRPATADPSQARKTPQ